MSTDLVVTLFSCPHISPHHKNFSVLFLFFLVGFFCRDMTYLFDVVPSGPLYFKIGFFFLQRIIFHRGNFFCEGVSPFILDPFMVIHLFIFFFLSLVLRDDDVRVFSFSA